MSIYNLPTDLLDEISETLKEFSKDKEYEEVFQAAMKKFRINSIEDLKNEKQKKEFFNYVDSQYKAKNESKNKESFFGNLNIDELMGLNNKQAPTYYEAMAEQEPISESMPHDKTVQPVSGSHSVASLEPNSAVGYRRNPEYPKHVSVVCDKIESNSGGYESSYRLLLQYPSGKTAFYPPVTESGMDSLDELLDTGIFGADEAVLAAMEKPVNTPQFQGQNQIE